MTQNPNSGWNFIEDGDAVPVRVGSAEGTPPTPGHVTINGPSHDIQAAPSTQRVALTYQNTNPMMMRLSAMTGIAIVFLGVAFYFGVIGIQGDITGVHSDENIVTITTDGHFSPSQITVLKGSSLVLKNQNANPQVLKPQENSKELFPVQVLFEAPYTMTIPENAEGTYTYISETLPESEILKITVQVAVSTPSTKTASEEIPSIDDIPLPFGEITSTNATESALKVETVTASNTQETKPQEVQVALSTEHAKESAIVSIGSSVTQDSTTPIFDSSAIPTNPYTVEAGTKKKQSTIATNEKLHSGAPLAELRRHTPSQISETGPANTLLLLIPALAGLTLFYRRNLFL